jgi:DNA-binding transcriptional regulator YdaS (Cro superfamily)
VPVEDTRPDVDWAFLRRSSKKSSSSLDTTSRKCG